MIGVASLAVTASAHPGAHGATPAPQPAVLAPQHPYVGTPSGITLLPYIQEIGGQVRNPHVAP